MVPRNINSLGVGRILHNITGVYMHSHLPPFLAPRMMMSSGIPPNNGQLCQEGDCTFTL